MQSVRLALLALLSCLVIANGASQVDGAIVDRSSGQLPGDDHGPMPAPAESEEGESPLFKFQVEAETAMTYVSCACPASDRKEEQAEVIGGTFSCSRELFNSLHRLRI